MLDPRVETFHVLATGKCDGVGEKPEEFRRAITRRGSGMSDVASEFTELFARDRKARNGREWSGSFIAYLQRVRKDPQLPRLAHARLYDLIAQRGSNKISVEDDPALKRLFGPERRPVRPAPRIARDVDAAGGVDFGEARHGRTSAE